MNEELTRLQEKLAQLETESKNLDKKPTETLGSKLIRGGKEFIVDPLMDVPGKIAHGVARTGKIAAKALTGPANLPVLGYNLNAYLKNKPEYMIEYPTEKVGKFVDWATKGYSKPRNDFERNIEPYEELALGMVSGSGIGKLIEQGAKKATEKGIKYLPNVLNKTSKVISSGTKLNAPTFARNVGALYGAKKAGEIYPENPIIAPIIGATIGGGFGKSAYSAANFVRPKSWATAVEEAALRHPKIGEKFIEQTPARYGSSDIMKQRHENIGNVAKEGVKGYLGKASSMWSRLEKKLDDTATFWSEPKAYWGEKSHMPGIPKTHGMSKYVTMEKPFTKIINEFKKLDDPVLQNDFMISPIGRVLKKTMKLPSTLSGEEFAHVIKDPKIMNKLLSTQYSVSDLLKLRRNIDNDISKKGQMPIGTYDERELRNFRGSIKSALNDKFEALGTVPYSQWKRYNSNYEKYAATRTDKINDVLKHKFEPGKAYDASLQDLNEYAKYPEFVGNTLKGEGKATFGKSILRDLGRKGKYFDLETISKNFHGLEEEAQNRILKILDPKTRGDFIKQLDIYEGYNKIKNQENNVIDALLRTPGLSVRKALLKVKGKKDLDKKFSTPEGIERLEKRALSGNDLEPLEKTSSILSSPIRVLPQIKESLENQDPELNSLFKKAQDLGVDISHIWK